MDLSKLPITPDIVQKCQKDIVVSERKNKYLIALYGYEQYREWNNNYTHNYDNMFISILCPSGL